MKDTEMTINIAAELYLQIIKELKEKSFTEEVLNAIKYVGLFVTANL